MKKVRILMMCFVLLAAFSSCSRSDGAPEENGETGSAVTSSGTASDLSEAEEEEETGPLDYGLDEFDISMIDYLSSNGYYSSNFIVSPVSFRASLCLAAAGAGDNTRTELLNAAGFSGADAAELWCKRFKDMTAAHEYSLNTENSGKTFSGGLSVWSNKDRLGVFTDAYSTLAQEQYRAGAYSPVNDDLTAAVNNWFSERMSDPGTHIAGNMSGASSVLISALYMQTLWRNGFSEASEYKIFKDINGNEKRIGFMEQTGRFYYAEESGTAILAIPMKDNLSFVCYSGNRINLPDKTAELKRETVHVVLPEFEMRSVFSASDLVNFLITKGVSDPISKETANFANMCADSDWFLQEVMQAAEIKVTAGKDDVNTSDAFTSDEKNGITEFTANGPFSFAVFSDLGTKDQQMLLFGQMMTAEE